MADQTVRITDMPDPSTANAALTVYRSLRSNLPAGKEGVALIEQHLHLYAACVAASRSYGFDLSGIK